MGRDYFGLISGRIPSSITEELPFVDMCCTFDGYVPRFEGCGCICYETDESNSYILQTECHHNGNHKNITRDTSMARWSITRHSRQLLQEKIRYIEMCIPIRTYAYVRHSRTRDEVAYDINYTDDCSNITDKDIIHKVFMWCVMMEIIVAFDRYRLNHSITFTSDCI